MRTIWRDYVKKTGPLIALLLVLSSGFASLVWAQDGGAVLRINPYDLNIAQVGTTGVSHVWLDGVRNFHGIDLRITFDPTVVQVQDAEPDKPGTQIAIGDLLSGRQIFTVKNTVDNAAGVIELAVTWISGSSIDGSGALADITWVSRSTGQSEVNIVDATLSDSDGMPIVTNISNGIVTVGDTTPTPLPSITPQPSTTPPPTITPTPTPSVTISGRARLQSRNNHRGIQVYLTRAACPEDFWSSTVRDDIGTLSTVTNAAGDFSISPVAGVTYQCLLVVHEGFLVGQRAAPQGQIGTITLPGGDVTRDGIINVFDLALIASRYRMNDTLTDINADQVVNVFDLSIAARNFGRVGPVTDWQ